MRIRLVRRRRDRPAPVAASARSQRRRLAPDDVWQRLADLLAPRPLLDRLAAVDVEHPVLDPARAEAALQAHLGRLGLAPRPVRWLPYADAGLAAGAEAHCVPAVRAHWSARQRAREAVRTIAKADPAMLRLVRAAAWPRAQAAARWTAWTAARWAAERGRPHVGGPPPWWPKEWGSSTAELAAEAQVWLTARAAAPRRAHGETLASVDRWTAILLPLVEAYETGLWLFWILERETIAVPRPALRIEGGRLHSAEGPAVFWPGGPRYWFWQGVQVERRTIEAPETRFLRESGASVAAMDGQGTLWRLEAAGEEPLVVVEVENRTPEPDGSFRRHVVRVPPWMQTPRQAVAWTFDLPEPEYEVGVET